MSKYEFLNVEKVNYQELKDGLLESLRELRLNSGIYFASTGHWYRKSWIRDNFYASLPELEENPEYYVQTYQTILDYYIKMEKKYGKFSWLIKEPQDKRGWRFPHPRCTVDLDEIPENWGFIQIDCFGEILYGIYLGEAAGLNIIRNDEDRHIINLIIKMLEAIEYWNCEDNAIWEENLEVHSSSVGACLAGLTAIRLLDFEVSQYLLDKAHEKLNELLPRESITKDVDLALLTLIYPFNILDVPRAKQIIANVEAKLVTDFGGKRYIGDKYYNPTGKIGDEPSWCFMFSFLALSYMTIGNFDKARYYFKLMVERTILTNVQLPVLNKENGEETGDTYVAKAIIPEMLLAKTNEPNHNIILAWCNSLGVMAIKSLGLAK